MKPHGVDFGRYTQWARPDNPPKPIDFVIGGITSGNYVLQTYEANLVHLQAEKRRMTYHFYETYKWAGRKPETQAGVYIRYADPIEPHVVAVDWEDTSYFTLEKTDVYNLAKMFEILNQKFDRTMLYSNIDDYELIVKYAPQFAKDVELWIAYPDENIEHDDWPYRSEEYLGRAWETVRFLQYDWSGDGPAYGTLNNKLSMDLDVYQGTMQELDTWLGITDQPEGEPTMLLDELQTIHTSLGNIITLLSGDPPPEDPEEPPEEPEEPEEPEVNWADWQTKLEEEWPRQVLGYDVAYVLVKAGTLIEAPDKNNVLLPYENENLRGSTNTRAKRLKFSENQWVMVWKEGPIYKNVPNKNVRPYAFDGGNLAYKVMHEQRIDGRNLWRFDLPEIFVRVSEVIEVKE